MKNIKSQQARFGARQGAAALISAIIISAVMLSIVLSAMFLSLNIRASLASFSDSMSSFYAAEAGVKESLMQLRREPNNYTFSDFVVGGITVSSEFVEIPGACDLPPECQFTPDSGWWGEYFNYSETHPDMQVDPYPGPTPTPLMHDWYDDIYKTHEQVDANIEFATSMWFPYDGTIYENKEGYPHDYHFGMHWRAKVVAASDNNYGYSLASDDDSWVLKDGMVIVNNSGTHAADTKTGFIFLSAGDNIVDVYFADRHDVEVGFSFSFDDPGLIITPWPEGCGDTVECNSNIQATASTTRATRKDNYTCNQNIENCDWSELIP